MGTGFMRRHPILNPLFQCSRINPISLPFQGPWDDEDDDLDPFVDDPNDLLGKDITFEVKIGTLQMVCLDGGRKGSKEKNTFFSRWGRV